MAMQVDPSVTFDQVGGMDHYIRALKEMIFLPLVYPELFERFHISPPRGVLFYGPPGAQRCLQNSLRVLREQWSPTYSMVTAFSARRIDIGLQESICSEPIGKHHWAQALMKAKLVLEGVHVSLPLRSPCLPPVIGQAHVCAVGPLSRFVAVIRNAWDMSGC